MENFYSRPIKSSYSNPARQRFCVSGQKIVLLFGKTLLLMMIFFLKTGLVKGQNDNHLNGNSDRNEVIKKGYDQYGAYVDFIITYYDDESYDSWINPGHIDCKSEGEGSTEIIRLSSEKQDDNDEYFVSVKPVVGNIQARTVDLDDNDMSSWRWVTNNNSAEIYGRQNGYDGDGDGIIEETAALYIRWYVPHDFVGKTLTFSYTRKVYDSDNDNPVDQGDLNGHGFGIGQPSYQVTPLSLPNLSWDFSSEEPGRIAVKYTYSNPAANMYHVIFTFNGFTTSPANTQENPSGTFYYPYNIPVNRTTGRNLDFTTAADLRPVSRVEGEYAAEYKQTQQIMIPAYIWPNSLNAAYDGENTVTLSWKVLPPGDENVIKGDNFEMQRSTDTAFQENVKTVGTIAYDVNQADYSMVDDLADITGGSHVYYRLRRTKSSAEWGWGEVRKTDLDVQIMTELNAKTAVLDETDGPVAIITWDSFEGVWTSETTFTLKKEDITTGQTITINLTEEEARSGEYIDENIQYCKEFSYSILLTPGNGYPSPPEAEVDGRVLAVNIGTISSLAVSKGYFTDRVEMSWQTEGGFDSYLVRRRKYGSSGDFLQIASIPATAATKTVSITDNQGAPGTYYEYSIVGAVSCGDSIRYSRDTLNAVGFRSPTGNIYGRVTYENGQAVQDVVVRLENDDQEQLGQSIYLDGSPGSYLVLDSLITPFDDSAFTVEAWIRPDEEAPVNQVIFSRKGQYELGFDDGGQLYFSYNGKRVSGAYHNTPGAFIHLTGIHSLDTLRLMLNDSLIAEAIHAFEPAAAAEMKIFLGRNEAGSHFSGYLDEVRVWNRVLSAETITRQYTRLLAGGEAGLAAYWRFDETIIDQFYDLSHLDEEYNRNDGKMDPGHVQRSDIIPTPGQLSLKAYTDSTGNYMITGIPYFGNGSTYTIVPLLGTHQFDPVLEKRLISAADPSFTVNFVDKSSFPVSGYVYYLDGTVPVEGVRFQIDGKYAQRENGDLIQTDVNGKFTISVPVGTHEVRAVKNNHIFVNGGKITNRFGQDLNYQGPVSERILRDSTTIRFIGRVAGGALQESYPLGHSLSSNNLGKEISVTMTLPTGSKYDLHSGSPDTTVWVPHLAHPGEDTVVAHRTRVVYHRNKIVIYPDPITGEFQTNLIPEKFTADNVSVTGWGNLLEGEALALDLTSKFMTQFSVHSYTDSTATGEGWEYTDHTDTVYFNDSYQFIKRVNPSVSVVQLDGSNAELSYFGDPVYELHALDGSVEEIPAVNPDETGRDQYIFNYPVFSQRASYRFKISAFEEYPFYESVKPDGTPVIALKEGKEVRDKVPTGDGKISVLNTIRSGAASADTLGLDSAGVGYYDFEAGDPATTSPGLKSLSVTVRFGQASNLTWTWLGQPTLEGYVTGAKITGTGFVTAGPDKLLTVLRDPPGNKSYSFMEEGATYSSSSTYNTSVDNVGNVSGSILFGESITIWSGVGAGFIETISTVQSELELGFHHEEHYTYSHTKQNSTTFTTRFQTSDAPTFVGAAGDLYVGYSTNITYGQSRNTIIIQQEELLAADSVLFDPGDSSPYLIIAREGINFGEKFGTMFAYPQQHIVKVLIPSLIQIRNSFLLPPGTDGQAVANATGKPAYVSKLDAGDSDFGKSNHDTEAFGSDALKNNYDNGDSYHIYFPDNTDYRTDTLMILNQYVKDWEQKIADNEKQKLESQLLQNYSFHAGNPISYSKRSVSNRTKTHSFNIIVGAKVLSNTSFKISGQGFKVKVDETISTSQGGRFGMDTNRVSTIGFTLASQGTDNYISVDVNETDDGGFAFRTKGGATACPYEGEEVTKYYNPGIVINQATQRIEAPVLEVENPVVNDVPASQMAVYTLKIKNESEARLPAVFQLSYIDTDSIKGAGIRIDGGLIGGSGRAIPVQYGETVTKVLTLTKGPDAMDYENIPIILKSACQYDPTGYQETIADTVLISAHFVPACGNVNIKSPTSQWILNTGAPLNGDDKRYLPLVIDQFDLSNSLFHRIELQYKPAASGTWITAMKFYADSSAYNEAQGAKRFITNAQEILYNLEMDDASFNDQGYDIRAVSICKLGPADFITTPSPVISGLKDTYYPRLFGSAQPANGVLGVSDEIRLNFNETIAAGLLTYPDFQVRGIRNGSMGNHSVSVILDGTDDYLATEFDKNLSDKSVTMELWVLPDGGAAGTLLSHGDLNQSMELSLAADNHLEVLVGSSSIRSEQPLPSLPGEWAHVALVYNAASTSVSAFFNFVEVIHNIPVEAYSGNGHFEFGRSIKKGGNFFTGKMHEARIWGEALTGLRLQTNSLWILSGAENGLLAYYPMNEGKGDLAFDKAHGSHASLSGEWSTPPGKAVAFSGNGQLKISTGMIPITDEMDYTMALWFKGDAGQGDAALASNGRGEGNELGGSYDLFFLGFEGGRLTFRNNNFRIQADGNYLDDRWHHVAIAVNRTSGTAQLFVDGELRTFFDARKLGGIAAPFIYLGARGWQNADDAVTVHFDRHFEGEIDEFRLWNTYLNQTLISAGSNTRLAGTELGLLAYYPFETWVEFQNNQELGFTWEDMKVQTDPMISVPAAEAVNAAETSDKAPIKDRGPVENLQFDFVVNNDALIITLLEPRQAIDETIVTFQVKDVRDLNGNALQSPVTWSAYIDRNQLSWSDVEFSLSKELYAPLEFESYVLNSGGSVQHFRLNNLPAWLQASPSSGTVDPQGRQQVTFTVNEGLNIGNYDEIIYMLNDNDESEALPLALTVKGEEPAWQVNPGDFKYSMSVYGKLQIEGIYSSDENDILAAFAGGTCVGLTRNSYSEENDLWYSLLTIYGNEPGGGNLEFRIWDASTGKTYLAKPSVAISFRSDAIAGTSRNPVIFRGEEMLFQKLPLNEGWNWISLNVFNAALENVPATLGNGQWKGGDIVKNEELGFHQFSISSGWIGSMEGFNNTSLFMMRTSEAQSLSIGGIPVDPSETPISIKGNRWNYISYLPQVSMSVEEALAGYTASDEDVIKSQTGFAMYDSQNGWMGSLTHLEPGKGYMLYRKATSDVTLYYPTLGGSLISGMGETPQVALKSSSGADPDKLQVPVANNYRYPDNMTMVATIGGSFVPQRGDRVLAYVGHELRGKAEVITLSETGEQLFFLNIGGESEQPVHFEIERVGRTVARSGTVITYRNNSQAGTLKEPLVIIPENEFGKIITFPNPFGKQANIRVEMTKKGSAANRRVQLSVYDVNGHNVFEGPEERVTPGPYQTIWDGRNARGQECPAGIYFVRVTIDGLPLVQKVVKIDSFK